ncbi:MAG: hypothetical protein NVS2B15_24720 [Pseudarthrobacter sp.]
MSSLSVGLGILMFTAGIILRLIRLRKTVTQTSKLPENVQGCPRNQARHSRLSTIQIKPGKTPTNTDHLNNGHYQ